MIGFVWNTPKADTPLFEPIEETQPIKYLTADDFSLLYSYKEDIRNDICLDITQNEAVMLMKLAKAEAGNSDALAQAYVMAVILNRIEDSNFPNTVEDVIFEPIQFSTVANGSYDKAQPDLNSHLALAMIEKNEIDIEALYFEATFLDDSWQARNRQYLFEYKGTRFYR